MPPRSDSERYENAALRLKNGTPRAWQSLPWVTNRAAARWAKEGSTVVPTVKDTGVAISLACEQRPAQLQSIGRAILRHGPNIKHRRCGMTVRHLSAKTAKTTPGACTTGTVMLPWDAATRLKFGSCQPKPRVGRRKHIADGPKGAASRGRARQRLNPPKFRIALPRGFGCGASILLGHWAVCPSSKSVILFLILQWMQRTGGVFLSVAFVF